MQRRSSGHGPKAALLGPGARAGKVAPAWRSPPTATSGARPLGPAGASRAATAAAQSAGSKILISSLPFDVTQKETEELFNKTVGPLKEAFVIYNSQGNSKGMAIIHFQRATDAAVARQKYHGKIVDGKRPIRIEVISDGASPSIFAAPPPVAPAVPSLLNRIGPLPGQKKATPFAKPAKVNGATPKQAVAPNQPNAKQHVAGAAPKQRKKKGPKRVKKVGIEKKTVEQLDQEMEDYRHMETS